MSLKLALDVPTDIEERLRREIPDLEADVKEAYALELFRRGNFELSRILKLDRFETDAYLKRHNITEGSLTKPDLEADRETIDRVMGKAP